MAPLVSIFSGHFWMGLNLLVKSLSESWYNRDHFEIKIICESTKHCFLQGDREWTTIAQYFYNVKNGWSIILSKSSSKNLSNENKQWCFCCLQDKTWIKMPILWKHFSITEILWRTFWRNIWRSVFDVVKILLYCVMSDTEVNQLSIALLSIDRVSWTW